MYIIILIALYTYILYSTIYTSGNQGGYKSTWRETKASLHYLQIILMIDNIL